MITGTLTLALLFGIALVVHFLQAGEFWEAAKALVTTGGIFALLALSLTVRRKARGAGY